MAIALYLGGALVVSAGKVWEVIDAYEAVDYNLRLRKEYGIQPYIEA